MTDVVTVFYSAFRIPHSMKTSLAEIAQRWFSIAQSNGCAAPG
jgi:hypothetical protein